MTPQQKIINRLALAKVRMCRTIQTCCLCYQFITYGNDYRDAGPGCKAHVKCFADRAKNGEK